MSREVRYDLAGIGSMVVDAIHRAPRVVGADEKVLLEPHPEGELVRRLVGGVVLNHLGWARLLGLRVAIFGKQADDRDGRLLRGGMKRVGIDPHLDLSGSASSFAEVFLDAHGARAIYMARGATGEVTPEEIDSLHRPVIEQSATVTTEVSQLPLSAARRVLEIARDTGARTVVDLDVPIGDAVPSLGTEADFWKVLGLADVLKPSLLATRGLVSATDPEGVARELAERLRVAAVVITTGDAGCVVHTRGTTEKVATCSVDVLDTTGAGDAFLGGLLAGLHYGLPWEQAARLGNACGARCCEQIGAFPDGTEPTRRRVLELYGALGGPAFEIAPLPGESRIEGALDHFLGVAAREIEALLGALDREGLENAMRLVLEGEDKGGRVHVTGVGKPEHLASYCAALLSSTGTPATFLDATEATHGSVGQIGRGDVLIAISNSGETEELLACVRAAREMGARIVAVCGQPSSPLARSADVTIEAGVKEEGGPLGLAPRASFVAEALVLQALSVMLQERKGLTPDDYQRRHASGALSKPRRGAQRGRAERS